MKVLNGVVLASQQREKHAALQIISFVLPGEQRGEGSDSACVAAVSWPGVTWPGSLSPDCPSTSCLAASLSSIASGFLHVGSVHC